MPTDTIKDSGQRTEFDTGAVRDMHEGKGRYDLLPWEAIHEVAKHCEAGAAKYGERNCEKGIPIHSLIDSAIRHLSCYLRGMDDEPHLRAAAWNVLFAIWMEIKHPEMQDIPCRMKKHPPLVIGISLLSHNLGRRDGSNIRIEDRMPFKAKTGIMFYYYSGDMRGLPLMCGGYDAEEMKTVLEAQNELGPIVKATYFYDE